MTTNSQKSLRQTALRMLSRRDYSREDISQKLKEKGFHLSDIQVILEDAVAEGWLNDTRFTENYIRARRAKGYGPVRIQQELRSKGIAQETIADHLKITDNSWLAEIQRLWQKHFQGKKADSPVSRAKQMRFLQYRGFTSEQVYTLFNDDDL